MEKGKGESELKRNLSSRHINMIAIGGTIGTGLFVSLGFNISSAGPGGALAAYAVMGLLVYFLMTSLGEMSTRIPIPGAFTAYCSRFVDPALGFAVGWNYWFSWAVTAAYEVVAGCIVFKFWEPVYSLYVPWLNSFILSLIFFAIIFLLNMISARAYGEAEFWFAGIKVVTIILFLILGVLMIAGVVGGASPGFSNWTIENAPFVGEGLAGKSWLIITAFLFAGFSFQGTELVGVVAGETDNPAENVPKAINTVFWRILLFYIGAIIVVGFLLPYTDENLAQTGVENVAMSPFTLVFQRAGLGFAAVLMNFVILTSVLSCGNASLYAASRTLYSLALEGKAPKFLTKVNGRGVPMPALLVTSAVAALCLLTGLFSENLVFYWLLTIAALTGMIAWLSIGISHYYFRRAYIAQGNKLEDLKYKALLYPIGPIFSIVICGIIIIGQFFANGVYTWEGFIVAYIGFIFFVACYLGYKIVKKTKMVNPLEADLTPEKSVAHEYEKK